MLFPFVFFGTGLLSLLMEHPPLSPSWLPAFKKLRHPFLLTALLSSLIFGWVHVVRVDFSDLQQVLQFILKIATTGYTSGQLSTTIVYLIQLVFNVYCLIYVYQKVGKTIDYKKTLEEW